MAISLTTTTELGDIKGTFGNKGPSIKNAIINALIKATKATKVGKALDMSEIIADVQTEIKDSDAKKITTAVNDLYYAKKIARSVDEKGLKNFYITSTTEADIDTE